VRYRIDVMANETSHRDSIVSSSRSAAHSRLAAPNGKVAADRLDKNGEPREAPPGTTACARAHIGCRSSPGGPSMANPYGRHGDVAGADAKFMHIVDRLGVIGCLPMILVAICVLLPGGAGSGTSFRCSRILAPYLDLSLAGGTGARAARVGCGAGTAALRDQPVPTQQAALHEGTCVW